MTPYAFRQTQRFLHLAAAVLISWSVYDTNPLLHQIVAWGVVPALTASGLAMWYAPAILRRLRRG
jgi:hypothetical protein